MIDFPIDIWSIKKFGIEKWHKNFYWPVSIKEYDDIFDEIIESYMNLIKNSPPDIADALWALYKQVKGISLLFSTHLAIHRLQQKNYKIIYHSSSIYYRSILEGKIIDTINLKPLPKMPSLKNRLKSKIKALIRNFENHIIYPGLLLNRFTDSTYITTDTRKESNEQFKKFMVSTGKKHVVIPDYHFLVSNPKYNKLQKIVQENITIFLDNLEKIAVKYDVGIKKDEADNLNNLILNSIQFIKDYIHAMTFKLPSNRKTFLLVQKQGTTFDRCLCIAAKRKGYRAIGFSHGNYIGAFKARNTDYVLLGAVDTFVTSNKDSAELFKNSVDTFLNPYNKEVTIVSFQKGNNKHFMKMKKQYRNKPISSINKVMVLEDGIAHHYFPWAYQLELNLSIARTLQKYKIKSVLKKHPELLKESDGVYDNFYDEFLEDPFEITYMNADAYIIQHIGTTAFGIALMTNRPIIIFDYILDMLWDKPAELLRKRCRVIPSWIDEDSNKIMFDEYKLIEALQKPLEEINDEFINKYML